MQQLSVRELASWLQDDDRAKPLLLDVREPSEFEYCAIGGSMLMPLGYVATRLSELDAEKEIVCICHHGGRSMQAARYLSQQGFKKLFNLSGGVHAWAQQIDQSMPTY
ncbi:MAG TPA: rhodanese-like domain-containing protein [Rhodocyclaceae bacterium]|nr:rhodanese-like domain-containing protein [Rhodocyclaceae bacterium]